MAHSEWQRRIARAEKLGSECGFASEILRFYAAIARFQEELYLEFDGVFDALSPAAVGSAEESAPFERPLPQALAGRFEYFLPVVEENGPEPLRGAARELRHAAKESHLQLLRLFWEEVGNGTSQQGTDDFLARAFLQPYAVVVRTRSNLRWSGPAPFLCPFCKRKPGLGVLRPLGEGGQRSLVCSLCLAEWEFRRIVCPGCGEEDHAKLPVYTAGELKHVRVEACDSCRSYIKTVDLTKSGLAEPIVDEMAGIPLDVWAQEQGYAKLQPNLMQL